MSRAAVITDDLTTLCRGEASPLVGRLRSATGASIGLCAATILGGCGLYGAAIGLWRHPLQAQFVAIKLPALIFLTLIVNGVINGMLAQVLGSGLTFRQTLLACLMSFTTFALVVGSLSPLVFFMVLNTPAPTDAGAAQWHAIFLLANTSIVAYAGVVANYKMLSVLDEMTGDRRVALKVLMAWLAGNLFVGAQLSWNLRPFFGNPSLGVQFLRDEPFRGNFYQDVVEKVSSLIELGGGAVPLFALALITAVLVGAVLFPTRTQAGRTPHRNGTRQGDKDAPPGRR